MSKELKPIEAAQSWIASYNQAFDAVVAECDVPVTFKREAGFALQILSTNDFTLKVALANPDSLRHAILNAARTGITLDPSRRLAYLLPRDGRVIFEPSYMGMIAQATDTGSIVSASVSLVYSNDVWEYEERETGTRMLHRRPRLNQKRGELEGAYVRAVLPDGSTQIKVCTAEYLEKCKAKNESVKQGKFSAYTDWSEGMHEKAAIKLAAKFWPKVIGSKVIAATAFNMTGDPDHGGDGARIPASDGDVETTVAAPEAELINADDCGELYELIVQAVGDDVEAQGKMQKELLEAFSAQSFASMPRDRMPALRRAITAYNIGDREVPA